MAFEWCIDRENSPMEIADGGNSSAATRQSIRRQTRSAELPGLQANRGITRIWICRIPHQEADKTARRDAVPIAEFDRLQTSPSSSNSASSRSSQTAITIDTTSEGFHAH